MRICESWGNGSGGTLTWSKPQMLEKSILRERFQSLLEQQRKAAEVYEDLASKSDDPNLKRQAIQIHREKQRHIRLTERLIEIVN